MHQAAERRAVTKQGRNLSPIFSFDPSISAGQVIIIPVCGDAL